MLKSQHWNSLEPKTLGTKVQHLIPRPLRHQFTHSLFTDGAEYITITLPTAHEVSNCSQFNIYTTLIGSYTIKSKLNSEGFFRHHFNLYTSVNEITFCGSVN